ncbi:hypothetical protein BDV25DRAFT_171465 [Aspergillus avenaceus]|uniref:C2H2-type domain-containing protein n=1 Tax=Aspergillus avenaceus TaxID=36643 RepID=A0A5N6TYI6_ASPAV|nr:hypothetical protein BDV25DRAFT_171465 [Aspergillus avenaceus]
MPPRKRSKPKSPDQLEITSVGKVQSPCNSPGRPEVERTFRCHFCAKAFQRKEHLQRHERLHTKEKPFQCTTCFAGFARRDLLGRHTRLIHEKNDTPHGETEAGHAGHISPSGVTPNATTLTMPPAQHSNSFGDFDSFIDSLNGTYGGGISSFYVDQQFFPPPGAPLFPTAESQHQLHGSLPGSSTLDPSLFDEFTSTLPSFDLSQTTKNRKEPWKVTQDDWDCLLIEVRNFGSTIPQGFVLPSRHTLTRYISTYLAGFHRHLPFIHIPTFSITECPVELLFAMATIGAVSAFDTNNAIKLFRTGLSISRERIRRRKEQRRGDMFLSESTLREQSDGFDPLPLAQALLILMAMATWGNSEFVYDEAVEIQNILVYFVRTEKLLAPQVPRGSSWGIWIQEEGFRRTVVIIFCFLIFHTIVYDTPPPILNSELNIRLPSPERDWEAQTEEEWQKARSNHGTEPDFQSMLASLFSSETRDTHEQSSSLGGYTLILALIQHIYFLRTTANCRPAAEQGISSADMTETERALKNWQNCWNKDPESFLGPGSPLGPISFNSTALLRMAYIRLNVDLGPWRALNTHNHHDVAMSIYRSPPLTTNRRLTRAVLYSAHALSIPVKIGVNIVTHNQAFSWSLQHSLCALECAFIMSKWLVAIIPQIAEGTVDEEDARLHAYIVDMVTEAEAGGEMNSSSTNLCSRVVRIWARILSGTAHWNVVRMIGKILDAYAQILNMRVVPQLLSQLHQTSLDQEATISKKGKVFSSEVLGKLQDKHPNISPKDGFDLLMRDKFIALDEDKCHFTHQLINAMGATNTVEAGTSFGVSTIYLALAIATTKAATGKSGVAAVSRNHWAQCGPEVEQPIDLSKGNLLETLKDGLPEVDLLLLDIWSALSLPTLKAVLPHLRPGAVVLTDNTISGAKGYAD